MDPDRFASAISAMEQISSEMEKYISYAHILTEKSTSRFRLIETSLKMFYAGVFLKDYEQFERYDV